MVKRACYDKVGFYDENLKIGEDYDMWVRILRHYDLRYIPLPLAKYRCHQTNASSPLYSDSYLLGCLQRIHRKLLNLALPLEFSSELEQVENQKRKLLLARAFASRGEGALRWGLKTEAFQEFYKAVQIYPDILRLYKDKWAQYPSLWENMGIVSRLS